MKDRITSVIPGHSCDEPSMLAPKPQLVYTLILPCMFLLIDVDKLKCFTCIIFLIYSSTKTQLATDLFESSPAP